MFRHPASTSAPPDTYRTQATPTQPTRMPLLKEQLDIFPPGLLDRSTNFEMNEELSWYACYTRSRQEKKMMTFLRERELRFYSPLIPKKYRSPNGRLRTSFIPLFPNYVFINGDESVRYQALQSNRLSKIELVEDARSLLEELLTVQRLIATKEPLTQELKLQPGDAVRVKNGVFRGFEGTLLRRENEHRLLVSVTYMQQGVSVALDDCQLELI